MSQNNGVLITAPIRPFDSADTYPTFYANEGKGGLHQYSTLTELNQVSSLRLSVGMLAYVESENNYFKWNGVVWESFSFGDTGLRQEVADISASLQSQIDNISGGTTVVSGSVFNQGVIPCNINDLVYIVNHIEVDINTVIPVISISIPDNTTYVVAYSIRNRTPVSFEVVLSDFVPTSGFNILWHLGVGYIPSIPYQSQSILKNLDTTNLLYTITHSPIDLNLDFPTCQLILPTSGSPSYSVSVTNRTTTSFDIVLSDIPGTTGYKVLSQIVRVNNINIQ